MIITVEFYLFYVESYNLTSDQWVRRPSSNLKKGRLAEASYCGKVLAVGEMEITTLSMLQKVL